MLTGDFQWQKDLRKDDLNLTSVTAKFYVLLREAMKKCFSFAKKIELPVLLIQGEKDLIANPSKVKKFFDKLNSNEKQFFLLKNFYHSLSIDRNREIIFSIIVRWLNQRLYLIENYEKLE
jgi:esterase/lipase